ncbi:MAG: DUF5610 domain-containing protein [Comamonas sp.]
MVASTSGLAAFNTSTNTTGAKPSALEEAQRSAATSREGQRAQHNAQILQASMDVSISAGNKSMTLLYRAAVDKLNEVLEPELGPDAIAQAQQQDQSSEAVANRIVSLSTALFERYAAKYPKKDPETLLQDFVATIRSGFEQGYGEATGILQGLSVWGEDSPVRSAIERTYGLVQQGFDDFLQQKLAALKAPQDGSAAAATA